MGWQKRGRNGRTYYYKSIRKGDKVTTRYEGSSEFAQLLAEMDALEARLKRIDRLKRCLAIEDERRVVRYFRGVEAVFRASLAVAGYHQHARGEWRMSRATGTELEPIETTGTLVPATEPKVYTAKEVHEIALRAAEGDKTTVGDIQAILKGPKRAALLKACGNPAFYLRQNIIGQIAGQDLFVNHAISEAAEELEAELTPPDATPIDRLLAERVVVCWLAVNNDERLELRNLSVELSPQMRELLQRRVERANARFLASVKALETTQRLRGGSTTVSMSRTEKLTLKQE